MSQASIPAMAAPPPRRDNRFTRSLAGVIGLGALAVLVLVCVASLPWTLGSAGTDASGRALPARYKHGELIAIHLPPTWVGMAEDERARFERVTEARARRAQVAAAREGLAPGATVDESALPAPSAAELDKARPFFWLGTDKLGRDVLVRCLAGGGVSIGIGLAAAAISVLIGTLYGSIAGYAGGRVDAVMMRVVDVLYGLPYLLLVVLLAVAGDAVIQRALAAERAAVDGRREAWVLAQAEAELASRGERADAASARALLEREASLAAGWEEEARARAELGRVNEMSEGQRAFFEVTILLVAIGGLSWLTMARVIRGQVLSLKAQPFMEAARAIGTPMPRIFARHLLPNLLGPIIVYSTLTVPQAILQESFLSFLGIGVRPPLPSWGNLASEGLVELNPVRVRWWLIVCPCALLGATLLALNFVGEGLREAFDPKRTKK